MYQDSSAAGSGAGQILRFSEGLHCGWLYLRLQRRKDSPMRMWCEEISKHFGIREMAAQSRPSALSESVRQDTLPVGTAAALSNFTESGQVRLVLKDREADSELHPSSGASRSAWRVAPTSA